MSIEDAKTPSSGTLAAWRPGVVRTLIDQVSSLPNMAMALAPSGINSVTKIVYGVALPGLPRKWASDPPPHAEHAIQILA